MTGKNNHSELIAQLTEGIRNLTTSEEWRHYLDFQSRFYSYSFRNVLLIDAQCHEATRVAGFNAWRKLNRFVRKGEKAIWILAPMVYKNADYEEGEHDRIIRGFKFVPVFDIAQTDGEELPSICNRLGGNDEKGLYADLVAVAQLDRLHSPGPRVRWHDERRLLPHRAPHPGRDDELTCAAGEDARSRDRSCSAPRKVRQQATCGAGGGVHRIRGVPGSRARHQPLLLRVRRFLGRWWRAGHGLDQELV